MYRKKNNKLIDINEIILITIAILPMVFSLINGTNFGHKFKSNELTIILIIILPIFYIPRKNELSLLKKSNIFIIWYIIFFVFTITSFYNDEIMFGVTSSLILTTIFNFYFIGMNERVLKVCCLVYSIIAIYILIDFINGGLTANWNTNIIGIFGSFGVFWCFIGKACIKNYWFNIIYNIMIIFNIVLLIPANCRSSILSILIFVILKKLLLNKSNKHFKIYFLVILIIPLLITNGLITLYSLPIGEEINKFVFEHTGKLLFSGREHIWNTMYKNIGLNLMFGSGKEIIGNLHSLYMSILNSFGLIGVLLYNLYLISIYNILKDYLYDDIVSICLISFMSIYILFIFETVVFNTSIINVAPYLILSTAIGRVIYLKKKMY